MKKKADFRLLKQIGRDMHRDVFVELICTHGIGHHKGIHGCDGCCDKAPKEMWKLVSEDK